MALSSYKVTATQLYEQAQISKKSLDKLHRLQEEEEENAY